jgi:hypothetical protein
MDTTLMPAATPLSKRRAMVICVARRVMTTRRNPISHNGGVVNLFQESSLKCNATTGSTERPSHDDHGKDFSKDLEAIGSLYWTVGKADRDLASKSIATLLAQLQCASSKQKKRNAQREDMTSGTHGIVGESHPKRSQTFVTHHDYYRN